MKKTMTLVVAGAAMLMATGVFAMKGMGGMNCNGPMASVKPEDARSFFKETSDLRTEMMVKRIELRQEKAKATPDAGKVEALQKEMAGLRTQIQAVAKNHGMPGCGGPDGGCGMMQGDMGTGGCGKMGQKGGMGKGGCGKMGSGMGMGNCGMMGTPAADQTHQH